MQRLRRNTLTLLLSNAGSAALAFALSALVGRVLGQNGLGIYAASLAWIYPLALLVEGGTGTLITRDLARPETIPSAADYLHAAVRSRLVIGGAVCGGLLLAAPLLSNDPRVTAGIRVSAPLVMVQPLFSVISAMFRARQHMQPILALNVGMLAVQVSVTAAAFALGGDVLTALALNTLTSAGQLAAAFAALPPDARANVRQPVPWGALVRQSAPFAAAGVLAALQMRSGVLALETLSDPAAVGLFAAAMRFGDAARIFPNALFGALFPALSAGQAAGSLRAALLALGVYGVLVGLVAGLFGRWMLALTFGADFASAAGVLQLSIWAALPSMLRIGLGLRLYVLHRENTVNAILLIILGTQVALSLLWIPPYGVMGAAWALLLAETTGFAITLLSSRR